MVFYIVGNNPVSRCMLVSRFIAFTLAKFQHGVIGSMKGGPGASGRVLPPVTGRSRVRVAVSSHCTGEGKACY